MRPVRRTTIPLQSILLGTPSAFTLAELLTVIAAIAVLAALLLAALSRSMGVAQRIHCANNVRQIGLAMQMFVADKHEYPLIAIDYPDHYSGWENILSRTELDGEPTHAPKGLHYPPPGIWHCPAVSIKPEKFPWYPDYGYNCYGMSPMTASNTLGLGGHHIYPWIENENHPGPPVNDSEVAVPSEMIAIGDGFKGGNGVIQDGWWVLWRTYALFERPEYVGGTKRAYARHQGAANVMYCDGHVESPKLQFLFDDTTDKALMRWNRDHKPHRELLAP
jgi:prepilin-type processing-associated H-X9-DG protein/prepilin-type N-terminal cleavage/methylation domain-containing protein